jgi:DNA-binding NarL/FixJ family response regulator
MQSNRISVLLVDDHAIVRNGVRLMLSSEDDISIDGEAGTAQDALRLAQERDFSVALVDIAMPGANGLDLLGQLRRHKPKLAVLMLSTYSEEIYAVRALKLGAAGYLSKESDAASLIAAVRKAAASGKYISPTLMDQFANMIGGRTAGTHEALSNRELEVLKLLAAGESLVNIAGRLHLSPSTVTTYRTRILEKMGFANNAELVRYAMENGLLN